MKTDNDRAQAHIEATARQIATDEAVLGIKPSDLQQDLGSLASNLVSAGNHEGAALVTSAVNALTTNDKVDQYGADEWHKVIANLLQYVESNVCQHEETHRGGVLWEICDQCGAKWADDKGGKPEFKWHKSIEAARTLLAALQAQPSAPANPNAMQDAKEAAELQTLLTDRYGHARPAYPAGLYAWAKNALATPANMPARDPDFLSIDDYALWSKFVGLRELQIEDVPLPDLIPQIRAIIDPQQPVAASSEPVKLTDWDRISKAAATACNEYGQWMPERWIQLFVAAYNKE